MGAWRSVGGRGLAGSLLVLALGADATVIYRWVDERGRTHLSDTVPEQYRDSATRVDGKRYELTPAQAQEARARAARERAAAEETALRRAAAQASAAAPAAPASGTGRPPAPDAKAPRDCASRWRLFRQSEACFDPYRTVGGGIKPEAFAQCKAVPSPERECGPLVLR